MKPKSLWAALATTLLLVLGGTFPAAAESAGSLNITDVWARSVSHGVANGAIYLTIKNSGQRADTLLGAATDVSARTELHESRMVQGMMQMRPLPQIELAAGETVTFAPGAKHIMLLGLKQPLAVGATHPLTLTFANAGTVTVMFTVRDAAGMGGGKGMSHGGKGMAMPKQN